MGRFDAAGYEPPPFRPPSNGLGVAGFIISLIGFLGCPLVAPVGLIMSFIAMFREPKGFAIAGFVLGLLGSLWFLLFFLIFGLMLLVVGGAFLAHGVQGIQAVMEMKEIGDAIVTRQQDLGALPASLGELSGLGTDTLTDPWNVPYVYERSADGTTFSLRSAGPDAQAGTSDDIELDHDWLEQP